MLDCITLVSGCDFTVMDGDYVPALHIQEGSNMVLLPANHSLRLNGSILETKNGSQIQTVQVLGKGSWANKPTHDFYMESTNGIQKLKKVSCQSLHFTVHIHYIVKICSQKQNRTKFLPMMGLC